MMLSRRILHFEDEPASMNWLPGALLNHFWLNAPESIVADLEEDDDETFAAFSMKYANRTYRVEYAVARNLAEFKSKLTKWADSDPIVLLDLYLTADTGNLENLGDQAFLVALEHEVPLNKIFLISAYPEGASTSLRDSLEASHLLSKPVDALGLVQQLTGLMFPESSDVAPSNDAE